MKKTFIKTSFVPRNYSCDIHLSDGTKISFLHESVNQAGATSFVNKLAKRIIGAKVIRTEAVLLESEEPRKMNSSFKNAKIISINLNS